MARRLTVTILGIIMLLVARLVYKQEMKPLTANTVMNHTADGERVYAGHSDQRYACIVPFDARSPRPRILNGKRIDDVKPAFRIVRGGEQTVVTTQTDTSNACPQ